MILVKSDCRLTGQNISEPSIIILALSIIQTHDVIILYNYTY